jgi:hypothetical protein
MDDDTTEHTGAELRARLDAVQQRLFAASLMLEAVIAEAVVQPRGGRGPSGSLNKCLEVVRSALDIAHQRSPYSDDRSTH